MEHLDVLDAVFEARMKYFDQWRQTFDEGMETYSKETKSEPVDQWGNKDHSSSNACFDLASKYWLQYETVVHVYESIEDHKTRRLAQLEAESTPSTEV